MLRLSACLLLFFLFVPAAFSQPSLLPDNLYSFSGNAGGTATAQPITIQGQSFSQGYRISVEGTSATIDAASLGWTTTQPIVAKDNLLLTLWVRKIAPLDNNNIRGFVSVAAGTTKWLYTSFPCDSEVWTKYVIPFKALSNQKAGEVRLSTSGTS